MAILLYNNAITEEYVPVKYTFTDTEILAVFKGFAFIRSYRLADIPNTWCVWGQRNPINRKEDEYSYLGSEVLEQPCYSPILFIHDTEMDPKWRLTEEIILQGYNDFKEDMHSFLNDISRDLLEEKKKQREERGETAPYIEPVGVSKDKRVIYLFDIDKQQPEFFMTENLSAFADNVHKFLKFSYKDGNTFAIFANNQTIFVIEDEKVKPFIEKIIAFFESQENYEACSVIRNTYEKWVKYKEKKKKENKKKGLDKNKNENEDEK